MAIKVHYVLVFTDKGQLRGAPTENTGKGECEHRPCLKGRLKSNERIEHLNLFSRTRVAEGQGGEALVP